MNAFVDSAEDDLNTLCDLAATEACRREVGRVTWAHIMTRDVIAVAFGDDLEGMWKLMRQRGVAAMSRMIDARTRAKPDAADINATAA